MWYIENVADHTKYELIDGELVIGREVGDILVPASDTRISRRHAIIRISDRFVEVEDLNSLNGTFIDDIRIESTARWQVGQILRCGRTAFNLSKEMAGVTSETPYQPVIKPLSASSQTSEHIIQKEPVEYNNSSQSLTPGPTQLHDHGSLNVPSRSGGSCSAIGFMIIGIILLVVGLYGWQHYQPQINTLNSMLGQFAVGLGGDSSTRQAETIRLLYTGSIASGCLGAVTMLIAGIALAVRKR